MASSLDSNATIAGDNDDGDIVVPTSYTPFFGLFAAIGIVLCYYSLGYARKYRTTAAFLLPPFICGCTVFDNIVMATTGINRSKTSVQAMLAFHACVTPLLLLVCYEVAYLVHKQKGVAFCGIAFARTGTGTGGSQHRPRRQLRSACMRATVWIVSLALLTLNLVAAYAWNDAPEAELRSIYDLEGDAQAHAVCSVIPALALVVLALYVGLQLWNYGTFYSYTVHATCFNPWIWMLVGAAALLVGYALPSPLYALSSNAGEIAMLAAVVRMFREVHHDMQQDQQLRSFIDPVVDPATGETLSGLTMTSIIGNSHHSHHSHHHQVHHQSQSLQSTQSQNGTSSQSVHKYELPGSTPTDVDTGSYVQVTTPKASEVRRTDNDLHADRQTAASLFHAVVVASSRANNPLIST